MTVAIIGLVLIVVAMIAGSINLVAGFSSDMNSVKGMFWRHGIISVVLVIGMALILYAILNKVLS